MRRSAFTITDPATMNAEQKSVLVLDRGVPRRVHKLIRIFMRYNKVNVLLATESSADTIVVDEAAMVPEATIMIILSRFRNGCFTLIGDNEQLRPYGGCSRNTAGSIA
ncbi:hypothetical protein Aduo_018817 [Ancylostoma duodenale]